MVNNKTAINMLSENDEDRLEKLDQYEILGSPAENNYDAIAALAIEIFEANGASITFTGSNNIFVKSIITNSVADNEVFASAPITTADGVILGFINIMDVKPRLSLSEREMKMLAMLAKLVMEALEARLFNLNAERAYYKQIHQISHDLKNPVTSISLYAQLLGSQQLSTEKVVFMAEKIEKSVKILQEQLKNIVPV